MTIITEPVTKCTRSTLHVKHTFVTSLAPISLLACTTVTGNFIFTHTMLAWVWTAVINHFLEIKIYKLIKIISKLELEKIVFINGI